MQLTKTMATELGTHGMRVNAILPGPFETALTAQIKADTEWWDAYANKTALKRWAQPAEIAGAGIFLASGASSYVTGTSQLVDGGWMANDGRFEPKVDPSWGTMLQTAQRYMHAAPLQMVAPGLAITLTVLAFNMLGDGVRRALDPRIKGSSPRRSRQKPETDSKVPDAPDAIRASASL